MTLKQLGLIAIGVALGFLIFSFFQGDGKPDAPAGTSGPTTLEASGSKNDVAALRAEYDRQVAMPTSEIDSLKVQAVAATSAVSPPVPQTAAERIALQEEGLRKSRSATERRDTERLLAAGYSIDRIEFLRSRSEELRTQQRRADIERREKGLPPEPAKMLAHLHNSDLDLRYEIGDAEYERYLQALGRPTGVPLTAVLQGSIAEAAGLKAGDQIVAYDDKRIFNVGELNELSRAQAGSGTMLVSVKRDGQVISLAVPRGDLGIQTPLPLPPLPDLAKR